LTLASPGASNSLGANKALVVDGTAPTVSSVTSSTPNGTYKLGAAIFWLDAGSDKIQRADLDGSNITDVTTGIANQYDFAVDETNNKIYWTLPAGSQKIQRADIDGTDVEDVVSSGAGKYIALDVANNHFYTTAENPGGPVSRWNLDGTNLSVLLDNGANVRYPTFCALDLTNSKIYFRSNNSNNSDYLIRRVSLDGSGIERDFISNQFNNDVQGIALDVSGGKIYWAGKGSDKIYRANLSDGSGVTELVTGLNDPMGLDLDLVNNKMYWVEQGAGKIRRANLVGSGVEDVISGLNTPVSVRIAASV
jgi:hypothetical protein